MEIKINDKCLEEMVQKQLEPIDEVLEKSIKQNMTDCEKAAREFLQDIRIAMEQITKANILAKRSYDITQQLIKNPPPDNPINLVQEQEQINQLWRELYARTKIVEVNLKIEKFSKELNKVLNQKVQITYVSTGEDWKDPIVLLIDNLEEILKKDKASGGAGLKTRLEITRKQAEKIMLNTNDNIRRLNLQDFLSKKQIENLNQAFNEVTDRYNTYVYKVNNRKSNKNNKIIHIILWRPQEDWKIVQMGNQRGDLSQAYVKAIIKRKFFKSNYLEKNIDSFMEYVAQVDATPGLLQGDVSQKLKNDKEGYKSIQHAVKMGKASFMSLQLAIDVAIEILTSKKPFDQKALKKKKKELSKGMKPRNQQIAIAALQDFFEGTLPKNLTDFMNKYK